MLLDALLEAATLPLPANPQAIVAAAAAGDVPALIAATHGSSKERVAAAVFVLVASLQDARERL